MKKVIAVLVSIFMGVFLFHGECLADNIYAVKVPYDATVILRGEVLDETSVSLEELASGRIHDIARGVTGIQAGYRYYIVNNLASMDELQVYDGSNIELAPVSIDINTKLIAYASASADYMTSVSERVRGAAIAYHNRTGGYGSGGFYTYFLSGSDAAIKCEMSDSGRYWGQYVTANIIKSVDVIEVVPYGNDAFTAKARIVASGPVYTEDYTINFLFQNFGKGFFVTRFTMMK